MPKTKTMRRVDIPVVHQLVGADSKTKTMKCGLQLHPRDPEVSAWGSDVTCVDCIRGKKAKT